MVRGFPDSGAHMRGMRFVVTLGLALGVGCKGSTSPGGGMPSSGGPVADVSIQDFSFSPASLSIKAGTTVRWTNAGPHSHTATSDSGVWDSGSLGPPTGGGGYGGSPGGSYSMTFNTAGSFHFHCALHPPASYPTFTGTITVTP
jgi:plastocyanin